MANTFSEDDEPAHESSATARALEELALYNRTPAGEIDARPLPGGNQAGCAMAAIFETLAGMFQDTCLEPDLDAVLWSFTELFHKLAVKADRQLDENEDRQKRSTAEQDGSEIRSVELEALIREGEALLDRHQALEQFRDLAASHYEAETGSAWRPRAGSLISHRTMTAAVIDSREFLAARRRSQNELLLPKGPKIAFSGGTDCKSIQTWFSSTAEPRKAPRRSPRCGPINARSRKSPSSPTGPTTAKQPRSSATIGCSKSSPPASSSSRAPASPATSRTKPKSSEFPFSIADNREAFAEAEFNSQLSLLRDSSVLSGPASGTGVQRQNRAGCLLCESCSPSKMMNVAA